MCNKMNYLWRPCNNEGLRLECYWKNAFYMNCLVNTLSKTLIDDKDIKPDAKVWAKIQFSVSNTFLYSITFCTVSNQTLKSEQKSNFQYQTLSVQHHFLYSIKHSVYSIKHFLYSITFCTVSLSVQYQTLSVQYHFLYSIKHFLYSITFCTVSNTLCTVSNTLCTVSNTVYSIKHFLCTVSNTFCTVSNTIKHYSISVW